MKKKSIIIFLIILFFYFAVFSCGISYAKEENEESAEKIEGIYSISTALDDKYIFDIEEASKNDGARLQIWEKVNLTDNQKFEIKSSGDGYYTIEAVHSKKVFDVAGAGLENGTRVQQYTSNQTDAQKWKIEKNQDGTYCIMSKCNGLYLDIAGANAKNGVKLQVYEGNRTQAQKFNLLKLQEEIKGEKIIEDGVYKIKTASNPQIGLDVEGMSRGNGANVQIWSESNIISRNQRFKITYKEDGYYEIIAQHSEKSLDVAGASQKNGANIQQYTSNGTNAQKWIIRKNTDETYSIQSKANGLYIDVFGGRIQNGSNVQMYESNGSQAQKFVFEKAEKPTCNQTLEDGVYKINTVLNSNMCFDIAGGSYTNQANLHIWDGEIVQQKKFELKYNKEGYYEIINVNSGKVLDVAGGANSNGANVQQYERNNTEYQKWILQDAGNGYYYIVSKGAEAYLDIAGGNAYNDANVQIYDGNASAAQKFKLENVDIIDEDSYQITIADNNNMAVDVDLNTSNAQIWERNINSLNQKFKLESIGNQYYRIICKATGKVLTVNGSNNVEQQDESGNDSQKWKIETGKNGYYYIKSKENEKYLEVYNNSTKNGTNVQTGEFKDKNSQRFKFNTVVAYYGIDVSHNNGQVNWEEVKKSGIDFAIIRVGFGQDFISQDDRCFERNVSECERLGIPYGVYLYSYAENTENASSEADHMLRLIKGHNVTYGVWYDIEEEKEDVDYVNIAITFCDKIKANGYSKVGIYSSLSWFNTKLSDGRLDSYLKWVAQWNTQCDYNKPYMIWQYSSTGSINGIEGPLDLDIIYK